MIKVVAERQNDQNIMGIMVNNNYKYTKIPTNVKSLEDLKTLLDSRCNGKEYELVVSDLYPPQW